MNDFLQADAGAELKRLDKWLAKTEEKLDGGKIVLGVTIFYGISKYPNIHLLRKGLKYFSPFRSRTA